MNNEKYIKQLEILEKEYFTDISYELEKLTKESVENINNSFDIVDIISQFIELKKLGANFTTCCPFHEEDTPSFIVSPSKQIYHCFKCGEGGDSIKFIVEYKKFLSLKSLVN